MGQLIKIHLACDGNVGQTEGIVEAWFLLTPLYTRYGASAPSTGCSQAGIQPSPKSSSSDTILFGHIIWRILIVVQKFSPRLPSPHSNKSWNGYKDPEIISLNPFKSFLKIRQVTGFFSFTTSETHVICHRQILLFLLSWIMSQTFLQ